MGFQQQKRKKKKTIAYGDLVWEMMRVIKLLTGVMGEIGKCLNW